MTKVPATWLGSSMLVALLPVATAQSGRIEAARPLQVAIVGASVSAGFVDGPLLSGGSPDNSTVPLQRLVRAWLAESDARVTSRADMLMFLDAGTKGRLQVERTLKAAPDLVFAVDFLFWFGYGRLPAGDEAQLRLGRLQQGLDLLGQLPCPVVVGDLPDMTGASTRMIGPSMIPTAAVLRQLNERVHAWAQGRSGVLLFRLQELVATLKDEGVRLPVAGGELETRPGALLQGDRLHANRLGMAFLGLCLQRALAQRRTEPWPELPAWAFEQFVVAAGAEAELADLRAVAGQTPATGGRRQR